MKNPHAVALGKLGAKKGGHARAAALSPRRRRQISRIANEAKRRYREESAKDGQS